MADGKEAKDISEYNKTFSTSNKPHISSHYSSDKNGEKKFGQSKKKYLHGRPTAALRTGNTTAHGNKAKDISEYNKAFPTFKKPHILGHYSRDENGKVKLDNSGKRYLRLADIFPQMDQLLDQPLDLSYVEERYLANEDTDCPVPHILPWIMEHKDEVFDKNNNRLKYEFVMTGGTFKYILKAPYLKKKKTFNVFRLNTTYYVFDIRDVYVPSKNGVPDEVIANMGHKFELCVTSPVCYGEPDSSTLVNENTQYYHVLQTKIGRHNILYSANIDCVDVVKTPGSDTTEEEPIELCVTKGSLKSINNFGFKRTKLLDYWCKAFAAGIERTVCGFRNDDFVLTEMTILKTTSVQQEAQKNAESYRWSPNICGNFCDAFLSYVKSLEIKERTFYEIVYTERGTFEINETGDQGSRRFPEWYMSTFDD